MEFIYKMNDVYIGRNREGDGCSYWEATPSLHHTHKDYNEDENDLIFVKGFLKRGERKYFQNFSRVFSNFSNIFLSNFLFSTSKKISLFLPKKKKRKKERGIYRDTKKREGYVMVF